jgi:SAM-dependent methyltransferase
MKRETTNRVRSLLDEWLPAVVRERWPFPWLTRIWLGAGSVRDFKRTAFAMSDAEYAAAYRGVRGAYTQRAADTTPAQSDWVLRHATGAGRVLEVGPGTRQLTQRLLRQGSKVTTLDLLAGRGSSEQAVIGVVESLPFAAKSFDVTVACHVVEHVRQLTRTFLELERVTRDRVLVVTPRQRYFRVTFDYHLHFFYSLDHLASHVPSGSAGGEVVDGDLCLVWKL